LPHACLRIHLLGDKVALALADLLVCRLERGGEQAVLVADVMVEQNFVYAGTPRDLVDTRAVETLEGKFGNGGPQDFLPGQSRRTPHPLPR